MTSITLTGALSLISTNGDGPQMLTEAAEFVAALAQMGVIVGVEINLRPVVAEKPAPAATLRGYTTAEAAAPAPQIEPPANPQTPSLREAGEELVWMKLSKDERHDAIIRFGANLVRKLGHAPSMSEWEAHRPQQYPGASALPKTYAPSWKVLQMLWTVEASA